MTPTEDQAKQFCIMLQAGLPASQVLKLALEEAEKLGHKWPVRYQIK